MKSDFVGIFKTDLISSEAKPKISSEHGEDFIVSTANDFIKNCKNSKLYAKNKKALSVDKVFFQLNPHSWKKFTCGGWVDLISSQAKPKISSGHGEDFIKYLLAFPLLLWYNELKAVITLRIKRHLIVFLWLIVICGIFGCTDKNSISNNEYIFLPKTELYTHENSSGFYREYKYKYKYDSYGNIVKEEQYTKGLLYSRDYCFDTTYTYDENGKILKQLIRQEEFSTMITDRHMITEEGYEYFYNESGQLVKKDYIYITYMQDENDFLGYKYEYDEHGNCIKEIKYYPDGTEEINFEYTYNPNNKLIKKSYMTHFKEFNWHYVSKEIDYSYDNDGKLIYSKATYKEPSGEMSHYEECNYYYDEFNRLVKEESATFEKNGKKSREEIREYKDFVKLVLNK